MHAPQTVTVYFADKLRFTVYKLDSAFGAGNDTFTTAVTLVFVNLYNISLNHSLSQSFL
jgi:hypothetical protein